MTLGTLEIVGLVALGFVLGLLCFGVWFVRFAFRMWSRT